MNENDQTGDKPSNLRSRALLVWASRDRDSEQLSALSQKEIGSIVHELRVHQIELELQNEDLRAEELALQEERDRFLDLYESAPVGYLTIDAKGKILKANLPAANLLGMDQSSLLGKPIYRFFRREDADAFYLKIRKLFLTRERLSLEIRIQRDDGTFFHSQLECSATVDEDGRTQSARIVVMDISERKEAEAVAQKQSALTDSMHELSVSIMAAVSLSEVSDLALTQALKLTRSRFGYAGYIDPKTGFLVCPTMTKEIWERCQVDRKRVVFETFSGLYGWSLDKKTAVLSNTPSIDSRSCGTPEGHIPIQRVMCIPVMDGDKLVGQISVANSDTDYTESDMINLQRLSSIFSLGIIAKLEEEAKNSFIADLEKALAEIKTLKGLIPICASCKKIRDDQGFWHAVEVYIRDRTDAQFSHGICPDCAKKIYPEFFKD